MEDYKICEICGKPYSELHHVIFRSQCKYLENLHINFKYLCPEHHRGKNGPHMNRKIDLKYKKEYQAKIEKLIVNDYYTLEQLKNILQVSKKECEKIVSKCRLYKEGYKKEDIIKRLLGDRYYI